MSNMKRLFHRVESFLARPGTTRGEPLARVSRGPHIMPNMVRLTLGILALVLTGCSAGGGTDASASPQLPRPTLNRAKQPSPTIHIDRGPGKPMTITGTLGIDRIEGGCPYLQTADGTRYEVIYPAGWSVNTTTGELIDAAGNVSARLGDSVTVRGEMAADAVSICQIGRILRADAVVATGPS
jgi:hypothetical protein